MVRIYAWFFMHCRNHYSDSHANHVINNNIFRDNKKTSKDIIIKLPVRKYHEIMITFI